MHTHEYTYKRSHTHAYALTIGVYIYSQINLPMYKENIYISIKAEIPKQNKL